MIKKSVNNGSPYLLGLLCLIPLIGALVGVGLILYGILKYKDKKLVIIGIAGVIITVVVYSFLFYNLMFGKSAALGFAKISQIELNNLVKNIEFYKLENGEYPDNLKQLRATDQMIVIDDPLLSRKMDSHIRTDFQYQRIGRKYTLFSVGLDGVPNTVDDIYPNMLNADTSKFGLIKLR